MNTNHGNKWARIVTYVINLSCRDSDCSSFRLWWQGLRLAQVVQVQSPCKWGVRPWRRFRSGSSEVKQLVFGLLSASQSSTHHSHLEARHVLSLLGAGWIRCAFRFLCWSFRLVFTFFRCYWLMCIFVSCASRRFCWGLGYFFACRQVFIAIR